MNARRMRARDDAAREIDLAHRVAVPVRGEERLAVFGENENLRVEPDGDLARDAARACVDELNAVAREVGRVEDRAVRREHALDDDAGHVDVGGVRERRRVVDRKISSVRLSEIRHVEARPVG